MNIRRRHSLDPGTWPATATKTRVLVEHPDALVRWQYAEALRDLGWSPATCAGPTGRSSCPLVTGEGCPLVAGADVVFTSERLPDGVAAAVRAKARSVVVEETLRRPVTTPRFVAAVLEAEAA
jgi:hypothetical protein